MPAFLVANLLLQTAEITKTVSDAAGAVTHHAAENGPVFALLWFLVVALAGVCLGFYLRAEKAHTRAEAATNSRAQACQDAVAAAQVEWARQQAVDNGHAAELLRQSREQERDCLDRIDKINQELRLQDKESVRVIGAVSTYMGGVSGLLQSVQFQLAAIETLLSGRQAVIPRVSPPPPHPQIP